MSARRSEAPKPTRYAAMRRDRDRCTQCDATRDLTVHHIVPISKGGTHHIDNLVTLCVRCHAGAHGQKFNGTGRIQSRAANRLMLQKHQTQRRMHRAYDKSIDRLVRPGFARI